MYQDIFMCCWHGVQGDTTEFNKRCSRIVAALEQKPHKFTWCRRGVWSSEYGIWL